MISKDGIGINATAELLKYVLDVVTRRMTSRTCLTCDCVALCSVVRRVAVELFRERRRYCMTRPPTTVITNGASQVSTRLMDSGPPVLPQLWSVDSKVRRPPATLGDGRGRAEPAEFAQPQQSRETTSAE